MVSKRLLLAYEELRSEALGLAGELHRGWGMVVVVREGMWSWMKAIGKTERVPKPSRPHPSVNSLGVPMSLRDEATRILANMVLRECSNER